MTSVASSSQVRLVAKILKESKGTEGAIDYCTLKIGQHEEQAKSAPPTYHGVNEKERHQIMIDFYLAVSLMVQNI